MGRHQPCHSASSPLCNVALTLLSGDGVCFPSPWIDTGLVIRFDQLSAAEVPFCESKPRLVAALASTCMGWVPPPPATAQGGPPVAFLFLGLSAPTTEAATRVGRAQGECSSPDNPPAFRREGLVPTHPGARLQFRWCWEGAFAWRVALPWREVNLLRVAEATPCHLSLRLEGGKVSFWHCYLLH